MRFLPTILLAAVLLALPTSASAAICQHQPGQGATDQYCEIVPSGAGERPDRSGPAGPSGVPAPLPQSTQNELRAAGADGASVQALAQSSPAPATATGQATPAPQPSTSEDTPAGASNRRAIEASSGTLDAVFGDLTGGSTGRDWVPWALLAVAAGVGTAAWLRRGRWS